MSTVVNDVPVAGPHGWATVHADLPRGIAAVMLPNEVHPAVVLSTAPHVGQGMTRVAELLAAVL